jgi:excisionase family DNA binding protein
MTSIRGKGVASQESEAQDVRQLDALLRVSESCELIISGANGEHVAVPPSVRALLTRLVHELAQGKVVAVIPFDTELTTQEAADMLNVSRPYLIKLLERGDIPYRSVGLHRRVRMDDLLRYDEEHHRRMRAAIEEMAREAQELGIYE